MKVEYICKKCKERFIVERSGVLDRYKSYNELLEIGKTVLFPHFEYHYPNETDYESIIFEGRPGDDYDFDLHIKVEDEIGVDLICPLFVCRTPWTDPVRVGFAM